MTRLEWEFLKKLEREERRLFWLVFGLPLALCALFLWASGACGGIP